VRAPDGTITDFGTGAGYWITNAGAIAGTYLDSNSVWRSFLRDPDGRITKFSVSGAGTGQRQGTFGWAMNEANVVTGWWLDTNNLNHGFRLRCYQLDNGRSTAVLRCYKVHALQAYS
jgi:hypothetical protein